MALFNAVPIQMAMIAGKVVGSGSCTGVIGGTMTAGSFDSGGSALITRAPAFKTAPIVVGNAFSAAATTGSIMPINISGVTVSNCTVQYYASGGSINLVAIGEAKL